MIPLPAGRAFAGCTRARRTRLALFPALFLALFAPAILVACSNTPEGAPGTRFSAQSPVRFGAATFAAREADSDAAPSEDSNPGAAAEESATHVVAIVQSAPSESKSARSEPREEDVPRAGAPADDPDAVAARHAHPDELVGLKPDEVTRLLGSPALIRHDPPAQVWQYRGRDCVLDLFLYPPAGKGRKEKRAESESERSVVYYELRGTDARSPGADRCFTALVAAARRG